MVLVGTAQDTRTFSGVLPFTQVGGTPRAGHQAMPLMPSTPGKKSNPSQGFQHRLFEIPDTAQEAKPNTYTIWDAEKTVVCSDPRGADDYLTVQGGLPACRPYKPAIGNFDPFL